MSYFNVVCMQNAFRGSSVPRICVILLPLTVFFFSENIWLLPAISSTVYIIHPKVSREGRFMLSPDSVEGIAWSHFTEGPHSLLIALVYRWHSFWKKSLIWDLLHVSKGFYLCSCLTLYVLGWIFWGSKLYSLGTSWLSLFWLMQWLNTIICFLPKLLNCSF